jgi:hypothetical protein
VLFFNTVCLQFHKLPDSFGNEAVRLFPNPCKHHFLLFFVTTKPATALCLFKWIEGMKVAWCKVKNFMVGVAEP